MKRWGCLLLVSLLAAGCGREAEKQVEEPVAEATGPDVMQLFQKIGMEMESGSTNAAIAMLEEGLAGEDYLADRPRLFRAILEIYLRGGNEEEVRRRLVEAIENKDEWLSGGFGVLHSHYSGRGDTTNLLEWTAILVDADLPLPMQRAAFAWRLQAVYDRDGVDGVADMIPVCLERLPVTDARSVLERMIGTLIADGKSEAAAELLERIAQAAGDRAELLAMMDVVRIRLLLADDKLEEAVDRMRGKTVGMSDSDAYGVYGAVMDAVDAAGNPTLTDELCEFALTNLQDKPSTVRNAARRWVANTVKLGNVTSVPDRIGRLLEMDLPVDDIVRTYSANFYAVVNAGDPQAIKVLLDLGDKFKGLVDERAAESIRTMQLDGSFLLGDYARTAELIEAGIAGRDDAWHKMALNKVKAHQALEEGRKQEAIDRFRAFMEHVKTWDEAERDPSTGLAHTREMTLGRNLKRIGDIYASMGKSEESSKAFEEAADYYTRALAACEPDSAEYKLVKEEMSELPAGK